MKKLFSTSLFLLLICLIFSCKQNIDTEKKSYSDKLCYITVSASNGNSSNSRQAGGYSQSLEWNDVNRIVIKYTDNSYIVKELKTWISDSNESAKSKMESDTNITLETGIYTFNIELYNHENIIASGIIINKEIIYGNNHLAFPVYLDNEGSTTPITLNFDWNYNTNNLSKAVFGLYYLDKQNELVEGFQTEELSITNNSASFTKADFPCGSFLLKFELFDKIGNKAFGYADLLIINKAQTTINISLGNISGYTNISFKNIEGLEFTDASYSLPEFKNVAEILPLPVCNDIKNPEEGNILIGWSDEREPEKIYTTIPRNFTRDLILYPKWKNKISQDNDEVFLSVDELGTYLGNTEYNPDITVTITDKSPDLEKIKSILSSERKYINLSLKYCNGLSIFPNTLSGDTHIKSITLPDAISSIQDGAFQNCSNLIKAIFPDSDIKFGKNIFYQCDNINPNEVKLPNQLTELPEGFYRYCRYLSSVTIPDNIEKIGDKCFYVDGSSTNLVSVIFSEDSKLKEIGASAFRGCNRLTSINIPNSVTTIGKEAFQSCSRLVSIGLPENLTAINDCTFKFCDVLSELTIPNSVTELGSEFIKGTKISEISIPESVNKIATNCFLDCTNLTHIKLPSAVEEIPISAFQGCTNLETVELSANTRSIGSSAFSGNKKLKEIITSSSDTSDIITIPASVTSLGENTFDGCEAITKIQINASLYTLPNKIFNNCKSLASVNIPETVESIGDSAFYSTAITEIQIPDSVTGIGASCFESCNYLTSVKLPPQLKAIKNKTFKNCSAITNVDIPDTIESLGQYCFQGCKSLSAIDLPDSLTSIGDYALYGNYFTEFNFPSELTNIGDSAFAYSNKLTSITIPENVSELGESAFSNCTALTTLDLSETKIETIEKNIVQNCTKLTDLKFPNNLKTIVAEAFNSHRNVPALKNIVLPESVETIGSKAFYFATVETITTKTSPNFSAENIKGTGFGTRCFDNSSIKSLVIPKAITSIETSKEVFFATALQSITFPDTFTKIDAGLFKDRTSLKEVKISNKGTGTEDCVIGDNAFYGCTGLTTVELPSCTTEIGETAFYNCKALTSVTVSDPTRGKNGCNVKTKCFYNCTSLETIDLPESLDQIGSSAFNTSSTTTHVPITSITISDNMKGIGAYAFQRCNVLTEVIIKNKGKVSITNECSIGSSAFYECSALTRMDMPSSVTTIDNSAFYNDILLEGISFPEGLTTIGDNAFYTCKKLENISLPSSLTSIGNYAFRYCGSLKNITLPSSLTTIGNYAFQNCSELISADLGAVTSECSLGTYILSNCRKLRNAILPENLTVIPDYTFYYCNLSDMENLIPDTVTSIGQNAFQNCTYDKPIFIPDSVTSIGEYAFESCKETPFIQIPESVTSIGQSAFSSVQLIDYHGSLSDKSWWHAKSKNEGKTTIPVTATCLSSGTADVVCDICHKYYETIEIKKLDHDVDENSICHFCNKRCEQYKWEQQTQEGDVSYIEIETNKWKSPKTVNKQNSTTSWTITVPSDCSYTFKVAVSSRTSHKFTVSFDDNIIGTISGIDSITKQVELKQGVHTIRATYSKNDNYVSQNEDCGYITLNPVYVPID